MYLQSVQSFGTAIFGGALFWRFDDTLSSYITISFCFGALFRCIVELVGDSVYSGAISICLGVLLWCIIELIVYTVKYAIYSYIIFNPPNAETHEGLYNLCKECVKNTKTKISTIYDNYRDNYHDFLHSHQEEHD